jgi:hypothetical protein
MTGQVARQRPAALVAALALTAIALTLAVSLAPGVARADTTAPTWPAHPQPIKRTTVPTTTAREGFDWSSAGIGAGAGALLVVICGVAVLVPITRRARRARPA